MQGMGTIYANGVTMRLAASIKKFSTIEMVKNDSPRLRPTPRAPFVAATYLPIEQTCPDECSFKKPGPNGIRPCFADAGFTKHAIRRLEAQARKMGADELSLQEACVIDRAFRDGVPQDGARGGRDLRLHVAGDVQSELGALRLSGAAYRWALRGGGTVWTYTHSWRRIPKSAWGSIATLASVERVEDIEKARDRGYASAITVREHPTDRAWSPADHPEVRIVPCLFETRKVTCSECRLCLDRDLHKLGVTIGFAMHGQMAAEGRRRLPVIR